ncbi:hypothetical protein BDW22DRAFT_1464375 [Trametopsis cervina]|nr:hypothetical protein BDW22DRAFT_1464375 [Trametopsis cervina]
MEATADQLAALFPSPHSPIGPVPVPKLQAGHTHQSTQTVLDLLKDNHKKWHIYFNDRGFHNHASHHLLAIYAMGANSQLLEAAYGTHVAYQRPAFPPPEAKAISAVIDDSNWKDFLGDERYYQAYVTFISTKLIEERQDVQHIFEKYVFSKDANIVPGAGAKPPMMLSRFLAGLLHPLIHAGYGAEFSLPGLVSEGIAQAATHTPEAIDILPAKLFESDGLGNLTAKLASASISSGSKQFAPHALSILGRVSKDPAFNPKALGLPVPRDHPEQLTDLVVRVAGAELASYIEEWAQDLSGEVGPAVLKAKCEELAWLNTVVFGVGGWAGRAQSTDANKEFNADFLLMHLVTSSLLLPSLVNTLTPSSASLLLRAYFSISIIVYIARGRPLLPISAFYAGTTPTPSAPGPAPQSTANTLPPQNSPNPWAQIVQTTLVHPNEHLCKLQRALLHFAEQYGGTAPSRFADAEALPGAQELDGTLFVRVAKLTADRLGWMREGQPSREWDFVGFYQQI